MRNRTKAAVACAMLLTIAGCGLVIGLKDREFGEMPDGGADALADGTADSTRDGSGLDATDASTTDGMDAAVDAGMDAGMDAGTDAPVDAGTASLVAFGTLCQASGSCTVSLGGATSVLGDLLVLVFADGNTFTANVPSPWVQATLSKSGGENIGIWYYASNPGGIQNVMVTTAGTDSVRGQLSEWRGVTSLDVFGADASTSTMSLTVSTAGLTNAALAVTGFAQKLITAGSVSFTAPGGGWKNLDNNGSASTNFHVTSDYLLAPKVGNALSETSQTDASGDWIGVIATFR